MERTWDVEYPQRVADAGAKFIREYIAELRKEGKVKGKISLVVRDGRTKFELNYRE